MKKQKKDQQAPVAPMFDDCADLPLFSGTLQRADDSPFDPQPAPAAAPQLPLPGFEDTPEA